MSFRNIEAVHLGDRAGIHYRVAFCDRPDDPYVLLERRCGEHVMFEDHYEAEFAESLAFTLLEAALAATSATRN